MSTVEVDGATCDSPNTFLPPKKKKKIVIRDVAKVAMEHVSKMIRDEKCPIVYEVC